MTFVRDSHPYKLFKRLEGDGISVTMTGVGIYRTGNKLPFATQIVVTSEISDEDCPWLRCLTKHGTRQNLDNIVNKTPALGKDNKSEADTVMDIFTSANKTLVKHEKEVDQKMCQAVNELFADEIKMKEAIIADKDALIANQTSLLADKDAIIAKLQAELEQYTNNVFKQQNN